MSSSDFFNRIRSSDNATKYRWVLIFTGASVLVVVIIWIIYLSFVLVPPEQEAKKSEAPGVIQSAAANIKDAFSTFGQKFSTVWQGLKQNLEKENKVIIENSTSTP
jgi:hypothetical protein